MPVIKTVRSKPTTIALAVAAMLVIVGVYWFNVSRAATVSVSLEAESGQATCAAAINDATASGGKAASFSGCTTGGKAFYVDPLNGSLSGDGSLTSPWLTLQQVVDSKKIEYKNSAGQLVNAGAPVKAGSTLLLRNGYHGDVSINGAFNATTITVAADTGHKPQLKRLAFNGGERWKISGLSVSSSHAPGALTNPGVLLSATTSSTFGPARDIEFVNNEIFSFPLDDPAKMSFTQWEQLAAHGFSETGERVVFRGNHIKNIHHGVQSFGNNGLIENNVIENFIEDGIRGLGNNTTFQYNTIKNVVWVNDDHHDGFQSWSRGPGGVGTGVVKGNVLRGNKIFAWTDKNRSYRGWIQGIGAFDGVYDGWIIENNVVATDHDHGITFYAITNSRIMNNTIIDLDPATVGSATTGQPWIGIYVHKDGVQKSMSVIVRNNIAQGGVKILGGQTNIVNDHNIRPLAADLSLLFVNPAANDYHLKAGSAAINKGSSDNAPLIDHGKNKRPAGGQFDIGAYEFGATP